MSAATISGHPEIVLELQGQPVTVTVCANCQKMRTILFLSKDRWYCGACRVEGDARPTVVPIA